MLKSIRLAAALMMGVILVACGQTDAGPKAGSADAQSLFSMLPANSTGVFYINVPRLMEMESARKTLLEHQQEKEYMEFVEETGVDPIKDVKFVAGAITGDPGGSAGDVEGVAVVNLTYNRDAIVDNLKKKHKKKLEMSEYQGVAVYQIPKEKDAEITAGAFLDDSNIAFGELSAVHAVIDVQKNKSPNVFSNADLAGLINNGEKNAMFWMAAQIPQEQTEELTGQNPMLSKLNAIRSIEAMLNIENAVYMATIKAASPDPKSNKQIADMLNGFKAFGAMAGEEEPDLALLLEAIDISSTDQAVMIQANIPEDLMMRLGDKAKKDLDASGHGSH